MVKRSRRRKKDIQLSPIWDLVCPKCGRVQRDVLMTVKLDEGTIQCPCGHRGLRKKPCRVHARFYGDGFFKPNTKGD